MPAVGFGVALAGARVAGFLLVAGGVAGLVVLHAANRSEWGRRDAEARRLLLHYCDMLEKRYGREWAVKDWHQDVDILANGDVRQRIAFTIVARCDELNFVSFTDRVNWDWPVRFKRRVQVHVRSVEVGGEGGTRFAVSTFWLDDKKLKTFVHLDDPVPRDAEVSLVVDIYWPARCLPLVRGHAPDEFLVSFSEPVASARYVITLPAGYHVRVDRVGLRSGDRYALQHVRHRTGGTEVSLSVNDVEPYRKVGVKIDTLPR